MARRGGTLTIRCQTEGCREARHVGYDSQREGREILAAQHNKTWKCAEHAHPERYLTPDNPANSAVLVATDQYWTDSHGERKVLGRFWHPQGGAASSGSGLDYSAAHYAMAKHFPAGTRLVITAYTETPEQAEVARAVDGAE